jgi:hypothetical protein
MSKEDSKYRLIDTIYNKDNNITEEIINLFINKGYKVIKSISAINNFDLVNRIEIYINENQSSNLYLKLIDKLNDKVKENKMTIEVTSQGNDIYVNVTNDIGNRIEYEGLFISNYYTYNWFDKYILRISKLDKMNRIKERHKQYWNKQYGKIILKEVI